jgi:hypothetical protein
MIKGLVYLTGLATLGLVVCVAAVSHKVHEWPWGDYVRNGSEILADKLDPRSAEAHRGDEGDEGAQRGSGESRPVARSPRGDAQDRRSENFVRPIRPVRSVRHTVRRGDTLYKLSRHYYGDALLWQRIARANGIRKPSDMRVGRVLVIPQSDFAGASASRGDARPRNDGRLYDLRLAITPALEAVETHSGGTGQ